MKHLMAIICIVALTGCVAKSDILKLQNQVNTLKKQSDKTAKVNNLRYNHLKHRNKMYADRINYNNKKVMKRFAMHKRNIIYVYRYSQRVGVTLSRKSHFLAMQMFGPAYYTLMGLHYKQGGKSFHSFMYMMYANRALKQMKKKNPKAFKKACNMVDCETALVVSEVVAKNTARNFKCKVSKKAFKGNPRLLLQRNNLKKFKRMLKTCKKVVKKKTK